MDFSKIFWSRDCRKFFHFAIVFRRPETATRDRATQDRNMSANSKIAKCRYGGWKPRMKLFRVLLRNKAVRKSHHNVAEKLADSFQHPPVEVQNRQGSNHVKMCVGTYRSLIWTARPSMSMLSVARAVARPKTQGVF